MEGVTNDEIRKLLQRRDVFDAGLRRSGTSGNFIREVDVGRFIGRLPANKGARRTTVITVITDVKGNLVNTFPGTLGRRATLR